MNSKDKKRLINLDHTIYHHKTGWFRSGRFGSGRFGSGRFRRRLPFGLFGQKKPHNKRENEVMLHFCSHSYGREFDFAHLRQSQSSPMTHQVTVKQVESHEQPLKTSSLMLPGLICFFRNAFRMHLALTRTVCYLPDFKRICCSFGSFWLLSVPVAGWFWLEFWLGFLLQFQIEKLHSLSNFFVLFCTHTKVTSDRKLNKLLF